MYLEKKLLHLHRAHIDKKGRIVIPHDFVRRYHDLNPLGCSFYARTFEGINFVEGFFSDDAPAGKKHEPERNFIEHVLLTDGNRISTSRFKEYISGSWGEELGIMGKGDHFDLLPYELATQLRENARERRKKN